MKIDFGSFEKDLEANLFHSNLTVGGDQIENSLLSVYLLHLGACLDSWKWEENGKWEWEMWKCDGKLGFMEISFPVFGCNVKV